MNSKDPPAVGVVNEKGIVNRETRAGIAALTGQIQNMPGVVSRDVTSLSTIDNIEVRKGELKVEENEGRHVRSKRAISIFLTFVMRGSLAYWPNGIRPERLCPDLLPHIEPAFIWPDCSRIQPSGETK